MNQTETRQNEVRKYPRRKPAKDVYAVFGSEKNVIGKLHDISMGGVSCKYFTNTDKIHEYSSLELFTLDNKFYMSRIPCAVVYRSNLDDQNELNIPMTVTSYKVGVKFINLNYLHQVQLKIFVDNV